MVIGRKPVAGVKALGGKPLALKLGEANVRAVAIIELESASLHRWEWPARRRAKFVRYADDFVVMPRYMGGRLQNWIESKLEGWLKLTINREKYRVIQMKKPGEHPDFLGYRFRSDRDLLGRNRKYWHWEPSPKAQVRERETLRAMGGPEQCMTPVVELIGRIKRRRRGWGRYFSLGYPRKSYRHLNHFTPDRLWHHLKRRSPPGVSVRDHLQSLGLTLL